MSEHIKPINNPKVSIGMPVYNGEKFLRKRLDDILLQTLQNFELIISDNCSTDLTRSICEEYERKDSRIKYFFQKKNIGGFYNFSFVLEKARGGYFVWAAVDDKWETDYLEKNIRILDLKPNIVGSTGKVERYGPLINEFIPSNTDSLIKKIYKKIRRYFRPFGTYSAFGEWEKKAGFYLRHSSAQAVYSIFRTDILRKSMVEKPIVAFDMIIILNVLKYGDLNVIDEVLWHYYTGGTSYDASIYSGKKQKLTLTNVRDPILYANWCRKNYGIKFFLKNIDYFIRITCWGIITFTINISYYLNRNKIT